MQQQQQQQPALRQGAGQPHSVHSTQQGATKRQQPSAVAFAPAAADSSSTTTTTSSAGAGGLGAIRHSAGPRARRHAPYTCGRAASRCTQSGLSSGAAVNRLMAPPLAWRSQHGDGSCCLAAQHEQQCAADALQHQTLAQLLDVAVSLASRSLSRTMHAFQTACDCWVLAGDNDAAGRALDCAEVYMARTIHRMQIAQQLATTVLSRQAAGCQQQQQQHGQEPRLLALLVGLQRQGVHAVHGDDEEGEAEVCSSWRPL